MSELDLVTAHLETRLDEFFNECEPTQLPLPGNAAEMVLERYFRRLPPFGNRKKKAEFPDAFALVILGSFLEKENETCIVVSSDPDWKSVCESDARLQYFVDLSGLIGAYNRGLDDYDPAFVGLLVQSEQLKSHIAGEIANHRLVHIEGAAATVHEYHVEEVSVFDAEVIWWEEAEIEASAFGSATLRLSVTFDEIPDRFQAELSGFVPVIGRPLEVNVHHPWVTRVKAKWDRTHKRIIDMQIDPLPHSDFLFVAHFFIESIRDPIHETATTRRAT